MELQDGPLAVAERKSGTFLHKMGGQAVDATLWKLEGDANGPRISAGVGEKQKERCAKFRMRRLTFSPQDLQVCW